MFQMMITSQLPKSADSPPLLVLVISILTAYISIAITIQAFCIEISSKTQPLSRRMRQIMNMLAVALQIQSFDQETARWVDVAKVVNRLGAMISAIIFFGTVFLFLIAIPLVFGVF